MISAEEIKALMAKNENGLLPCPFCGGKARLNEWDPNTFIASCGSTSCKVEPVSDVRLRKQEAITAWNTRA